MRSSKTGGLSWQCCITADSIVADITEGHLSAGDLELSLLSVHQVEIVVGTPGRLEDLISTGKLSLSACRFFVLDECVRITRYTSFAVPLHIQGSLCFKTTHWALKRWSYIAGWSSNIEVQ